MVSTIFVADSDRNEDTLQEKNSEEDESEGEVDIHVPRGTIKSHCFTYINFSKYHFTICQTNPLTHI